MGLFGSNRKKRQQDEVEKENDEELEDEDEEDDYDKHKKEIASMSTKQLLRLLIFRDYDENVETIVTDYDELIEIAKEVD